MLKNFKKAMSLLLILLIAFQSIGVLASTVNTPTVFVIGDSTAATYSEARAPRTGWGQVLHNFFKDGYMVKNFAQSGMSAHSCYDSLWQTKKLQIKPGDYVLIQFGHNDSAKNGTDDEGNAITSLYRWSDPTLGSDVAPPETLTDNPDDYSFKWYLKQFVDYIEGEGAYPIFVTSVERRDQAINIANDTDSKLYPYVKAMKDLGKDLDVPVIDVWTEVRTLVKTMEQEKSDSTKELYMHVKPGEYSYYPNGAEDNTHLSMKGALKVAGIFAELLSKTEVSLKNYLVEDIYSVTTNKILPEKVKEDFYGAEPGIIKDGENYNSWYVSGDFSEEKSPYVQIAYEDEAKTNKAIHFYRDETKNAEYDQNILRAEYILKKPLGAASPSEVSDEERYVRLKYKFRTDLISSGFTVSAGGMQVTIEPSNSNLRLKRDGGINKAISFGSYKPITTGRWYNIEVYYDLKKQKITTIVDKNKIHQELDFGVSQISNISMSSIRYVSTSLGSWSYFLDDVELSVIDEDTYCDYVGILPDESYVLKETFNIYDRGNISTTTWNDWTVNNPTNPVAKISITEDSKNSSNNVLAFQRTGVPNVPSTISKTFDTPLDNGYYELSLRILKHNEMDNLFELIIQDGEKTPDSNNTPISHGWKISFDLNKGTIGIPYSESLTFSKAVNFNNEGTEKITTDKWYDIKVIYDLTGDVGSLSFFVNGELVAENITPPNEKTKSSIGERYNKGKIKSIIMGLNRTIGSTKQGTEENKNSFESGELTADVKIDDLVLKTVETKPVSVVYNSDETAVSAVSIKSERVPAIGEKILVAVYETVDGTDVLKGVSMCENIGYGKNTLSLETPLSVEDGDKVKVFFWDMTSLIPKVNNLDTVKQ